MKLWICKNRLLRASLLTSCCLISFLVLRCSTTNSTSTPVTQAPLDDPLTQNPACAGSTALFSQQITQANTMSGISFNLVGSDFPANDLIDIEFLPSQNGDALVIGQGGAVYYMKNDFTPLAQSDEIEVQSGGERGLLGVVADPSYASNCLVYFYFTAPGGESNQVSRARVTLNLSTGSFNLDDFQTIISFSKNDSPDPGTNHNGGGMSFENVDNLFIGVGDGGGGASADQSLALSQNGNIRLGKILRIVPSRQAGQGGYALPEGGNNAGSNLPEIYALGLRNPFTLFSNGGSLFIGDVGAGSYEEIDLTTVSGSNFGWPFEEGPGASFRDPLAGYNHGSDLDQYNLEDPEDNPGTLGDGRSIMLGNFYTGTQYNGLLNRFLIYSEFYQAWVRALVLDENNQITSNRHLGHLQGMSALQMSPDGYLYAVSLYSSSRILRLDLIP